MKVFSKTILPYYLGMSEEEANKMSLHFGFYLHISRKDEKLFPMSLQFDPKRISIELDKGKVTSAELG